MRLALRFGIVVLLLSVVGVATSQASPITWLYTGTVIGTPDGSVLPLGSPVTTLLTADPDHNIWDPTSCGGLPQGAGYFFNAVITLGGEQFAYSGLMDVNYDFAHCVSNGPGTRIVPLGFFGPHLGPLVPGGGTGQGSAYLNDGGVDPNSPAFPWQNPGFLRLPFNDEHADVRISLENPGVVPELGAMFLLGTGLVVIGAPRLFRFLVLEALRRSD